MNRRCPAPIDAPRRGDGGQAAVELALVLPLVAIVLLCVVQVALVLRDQLLVTHVAREAAREAAVDPTPGSAERAANRASSLKRPRLRTETSHHGGFPEVVIVEVTYQSPTDVPLVGALVPDVSVGAKAAMRVEVDRAW